MSRMNQAMVDLLRYNNAMLPQKRSRFDKSHSVLTTMDSADLVPIDYDFVLPGDEKEIRVSALARMTTPFHPVMDSAKLYIASFFIPHRLWWSNAKKFYGENLDADFNDDGEYSFPSLMPSQYRVDDENATTKLNDYLGFPVISADAAAKLDTLAGDPNYKLKVNAALHRCYHLCWNEYFRNSSIQPALQLNTGDTVTDSEWNVIKQMRRVNKNPDYFTTLLRRPQAGADVLLPMGEWAPVVTRRPDQNVPNKFLDDMAPLRWGRLNFGKYGVQGLLQPVGENLDNFSIPLSAGKGGRTVSDNTENTVTVVGDPANRPPEVETASNAVHAAPVNLWTNLTDATAVTINNLRQAITIQHLLEVDSVAGKRYQQILYAHWNVLTPDQTLQRPELLGISSTPIGMRQVLQTSATEGASALGGTGAVSVTSVDNEWICNKAFTEPGILLHCAWVRPEHSYSQGLDPLMTALERYEQYWPVFDNIGNQPVKKSAIFAAFNNQTNKAEVLYEMMSDVFGYEEAWTPYRIRQNRVSGLMRPDVTGSLATWNYTSFFDAPPLLNSAFITEDPNLIDRTLAVQDEPQFLLDVWFDYKDTRNMGVHSTPGITRI